MKYKNKVDNLKRKWYKQELIGVCILVLVVVVVCLIIESGKIHTSHIEEGRIYFEYKDETISKELSTNDLKAICDILDGARMEGNDLEAVAHQSMQIILGSDIHLAIGNSTIYYYNEKDRYVIISESKGKQMKEILSKYGYRYD